MILYIIILLIIIILFVSKKYKNSENSEKSDSYLDGIDIIYWINMDHSTDRKKSMNKMLKDQSFKGIPNIRIPAVDGNNKQLVYKKFQAKKYTHEGVKEYACLISHLDAINKFNKSNYSVALILEDDCTLELKKYWSKSIKNIINNAPNDWEIIMLNYIILPDTYHPFIRWENNEDYTDNFPCGTLSYIINKKASKKLINVSNNAYILNDAHHLADVYIYQNTKTYCYKYPMFIYKKDNDSYINDYHNGINENARNIILKNFAMM